MFSQVTQGLFTVLELSVCTCSFKRPTKITSIIFFFHRLKEAQENIKKITAEKRVETKKINANSLVRTDPHNSREIEFPAKAALSHVSAEINTLNLLVVLTNRKKDCGRRKPACPPAEMTSEKAEEETRSGRR